ncbi:MAG: DUF2062 domain-containing protein [Sphingomonadales bacterium]|nr:DUF2062 domain-containing protein [Sphingomonadales bacterium]MDE2569396.1 DUF2062 domain-containing protein [Sphingomonadales bacterium]
MPTREQIEKNRWVRPFAHNVLRPELWRFTRRSVPRGVALGLFIGTIIPMAHFLVAAALAMFVRANVPVALAATFIGNPLTVAGIWWLAYRIGEALLHADAMTQVAPVATAMQQTQADQLLTRLTGAGEDTAVGLFVIATVLASCGYLLASFVWRWRVARVRRRRIAARRGSPGVWGA